MTGAVIFAPTDIALSVAAVVVASKLRPLVMR